MTVSCELLHIVMVMHVSQATPPAIQVPVVLNLGRFYATAYLDSLIIMTFALIYHSKYILLS